MSGKDTDPGSDAGAAVPGAAQLADQQYPPFGVFADTGCGREQSRGRQRGGRRPVDGSADPGADEALDVPGDLRPVFGCDQIRRGGPADAEHGGDDAQFGDQEAGVLGWMAGGEQLEQASLEAERFWRGRSVIGVALIQAGCVRGSATSAVLRAGL